MLAEAAWEECIKYVAKFLKSLFYSVIFLCITFANTVVEYERKFVLQDFMRVVYSELPFTLQFCERHIIIIIIIILFRQID
jgi:hypothetical protein